MLLSEVKLRNAIDESWINSQNKPNLIWKLSIAEAVRRKQ